MSLELRDIRKDLGGFSVSVSLSVGEGETLALFGPSGCGKTTILNIIAGLLKADSGNIICCGVDLTELPAWKRNVALVFQDLALFPHLDVGKNISYAARIRGLKPKACRILAAEYLSLVRLPPSYINRRIDTLSGGEKQRVALARALSVSPRALLLDEPFSSLDGALRENLQQEFLRLRAASKAPCIFVTHDAGEARLLGDRVAFMEAGRLLSTRQNPC